MMGSVSPSVGGLGLPSLVQQNSFSSINLDTPEINNNKGGMEISDMPELKLVTGNSKTSQKLNTASNTSGY